MLLLPLLSLLAAVPPVPATPKKPVKDTYFDRTVVDDYRWLEPSDDPEVQKWSDAQSAHTRAVLDALPGREALRKRLQQLIGLPSPTRFPRGYAGGKLFALETKPPQPQPMLVVLNSYQTEVKETVLFDPVAFDPSGATAMDFFVPSHDGTKVLISLSKHGSESGDGHLFEVATGAEVKGETITGLNRGTAGGSVAWTKNGFFYTRYPRGEERPAADKAFFQRVWFHTLGTDPSKDTVALSDGLDRISENFLSASDDGSWVADLVEKGDGGDYELYLRSTGGFVKVARAEDKIVQVSFGRDGALYLLSKKDAPKGKVLRLPLTGSPTLAQATVVVPEGEPIETISAGEHHLHLVIQQGGPTGLREVSTDGTSTKDLATPAGTTVGAPVRLDGDDFLSSLSGYILPPTVYRYDSKAGTLTATALKKEVSADLSGYEVVRDTCTSKDGTKVPISIVKRINAPHDGNNPTLLTGYGGFGISMHPEFPAAVPAFLEQGGIYAVANLRGGREFGEAWHEAGMKTHKQNVFDDFIACAQRLVALKLTSPKRLAIQGGSNGGLLMGAVMTQQPKLAKAVVAQVGLYDMLRFETTNNGQFNITEYGSVKNEDEFQALAAYSPLHAVKKGVQYPALLMTTGANDPRVDPWHSRKFAAALQASGSKQPVLLRTSNSTGHGIGTPLAERINQAVDIYAFVFNQLGVNVKPVVLINDAK